MYDRELVLIDAETLKHVTTAKDMSMACLDQRIVENSKVEITTSQTERLETLPRSITISLDVDP